MWLIQRPREPTTTSASNPLSMTRFALISIHQSKIGTYAITMTARHMSNRNDNRCAYIRKKDPEGPQSELWTVFMEKMKECILSSFDLQVLQIQEDTRRLDMQRHMPGWNYCTFFILKEGLAQAFEIMTLYEDALIQYDELEASFFQVLRGDEINHIRD